VGEVIFGFGVGLIIGGMVGLIIGILVGEVDISRYGGVYRGGYKPILPKHLPHRGVEPPTPWPRHKEGTE
jgi:hypothetical protein